MTNKRRSFFSLSTGGILTIFIPIVMPLLLVFSQPSAVYAQANGQQSQQQPTISCQVHFYNPLTWIICPIIDAANGIINALDSEINAQLDINSCNYFNANLPGGANNQSPNGCSKCSSNNPSTNCQSANGGAISNGFYTAWTVLRSLALGVVVLAALFMVVSQAIGMEVLDAYTIKKVLPRMLIAVIGIAISWQLIQVLVQLSDDLGHGIRWLIYEPFNGLSGVNITQLGSSGLFIAGGAALATMGPLGMLLFIITAAVAVIIAFVLLTFRQILIIFLAIFAPIAIAFYILPGTQKIWKMWWSNFSKLLLMFPIISGIIAIGRVFAVVTLRGQNGLEQTIVAMIAYFGPYFMLPMTFKMSGGLMGSVAGMAQGWQSGVNKWAAGRRKALRAERAQKAKSGHYFRNNNAVTSALSKGIQTATLVPQAGFNPKNWASNVQSARSVSDFNQAAELFEKNTDFAAIKDNDVYLKAALEGGRDRAKIAESLVRQKGWAGRSLNDAERSEVNRETSQILRASRVGGEQAFRMAAVMAKAGTGTAYGDQAEMLNEIKQESNGDLLNAGRMLGTMRRIGATTRRPDLFGAGFGDQARTLSNAITQDRNLSDSEAGDLLGKAYDNSGPGALVGARTQSMEAFSKLLTNRVNNAAEAAMNEPDPNGQAHRNLSQTLAQLAGTYDVMAQQSPANAKIFADNVFGQKVEGFGNSPSIQGLIEQHRERDPEFTEMRREYRNLIGHQAGNRQTIEAIQAQTQQGNINEHIGILGQ